MGFGKYLFRLSSRTSSNTCGARGHDYIVSKANFSALDQSGLSLIVFINMCPETLNPFFFFFFKSFLASKIGLFLAPPHSLFHLFDQNSLEKKEHKVYNVNLC